MHDVSALAPRLLGVALLTLLRLQDVYDEFMALLVAKAKACAIGDVSIAPLSGTRAFADPLSYSHGTMRPLSALW